MTVEERIEAILEYKKLNKNELGRLIQGKKSNIVYNILAGKQKISGNVLEKIVILFPEINANWLVTGKGEMLPNNKNLIERIEQLEKELERCRKIIDALLEKKNTYNNNDDINNSLGIIAEQPVEYKRRSK